MPRLMNMDMEQHNIGGLQFSATRPDKLGQTEYTLVSLILDTSGSVGSYAADLLLCVKNIVEACKKSPRSDNLLLRYVVFNSTVKELIGFTPFQQIDVATLKPLNCDGLTALYDAVYQGIGAANAYGKQMIGGQFVAIANAITFIVTDGGDNASSTPINKLKAELEAPVTAETLESHKAVLVAVNADLSKLQTALGLTQYLQMSATPKELAKLAEFVSKSISSTSQSLGSGGPSQNLTF